MFITVFIWIVVSGIFVRDGYKDQKYYIYILPDKIIRVYIFSDLTSSVYRQCKDQIIVHPVWAVISESFVNLCYYRNDNDDGSQPLHIQVTHQHSKLVQY